MKTQADERLRQFEQALLAMNRKEAARLLADESGAPGIEQIESLVVPALENIGRGWEEGSVALSQVYMSGRLCEQLMAGVSAQPLAEAEMKCRIAIAALDDYHLLGLRLLASVLGASGIPFSNWGRMDARALSGKVLDEKIDILLISVLMLRSAMHVKDVRTALTAAGSAVRIIVGGAPFRLDKELWKEVGADATSDSAAGAVPLIHRFAAEVRK